MLPFRLDEITNERIFHGSREFTSLKVTVFVPVWKKGKIEIVEAKENIIFLSSIVRCMRVGFTYNPTSWIETAHASADGLARLRKLSGRTENDCDDNESAVESLVTPEQVGVDYFASIFSEYERHRDAEKIVAKLQEIADNRKIDNPLTDEDFALFAPDEDIPKIW